MKIKKFNENINSKEYYLIIEQDNYERYYLFEKEKNACDFMIAMLYEQLKDYKKALEELDNVENSVYVNENGYNFDTIAYYYNEFADMYGCINKITYENVTLKENFQFPEWIQLRRNTKKYNL